jgi:hypothetical protein
MRCLTWFFPPLARFTVIKIVKTIAVVGSLGLLNACQSLPQSAFHLNDASLAQGESLTAQDRAKLEQERVSIQSILDSPKQSFSAGDQTSQAFVLQGTITQVAPFLTGVAYQLADETGKIWVVSDKENSNLSAISDPLANANTPIFWVIGVPRYESIAAGGQDWGEIYLEEQSRFQTN